MGREGKGREGKRVRKEGKVRVTYRMDSEGKKVEKESLVKLG